MRALLPADLSAAVDLLLAAPEAAWPGLAARLMLQADAADRYRKRFHRAHPRWGSGTLMTAAMMQGARLSPGAMSGRQARALIVVLGAFLAQKPGRHLSS